ncbi:secretin and TonB N-terminal domain-containing protein [Nitrospina watsonii]|uniref:STN domain-containing protein n=1 Tax=Nitrospina watsonii TaxID=1323948 RepID=A0ABM9HFH3_9BACT|nr:TonB-dependent receptor [Nitrospina watsonii]CAI2718813.1 STN domain-containing protein [Nitrospina watsonii]
MNELAGFNQYLMGWTLPRAKRVSGLFLTVLVLTATPVAYAQETPTISGSGPEVAQLVESGPLRFDIPPQDLASALSSFGETADLQVLYDAALTRGLTTEGVSGTYTPEQALRKLLEGTDLTYTFTNANTVTLKSASAKTKKISKLKQVTVLGTRRQKVELSNVPVSISVVEQEQVLEELGTANQTEDILTRRVPGFNPTNNGVRNIRGRTAQVFINGVPVNEQLRASVGSDINLVHPDQLGGVEVSRGASAPYGFGSPGGIIALSTQQAQSEKLTLNSRIRGSFNPYKTDRSYTTSTYHSASQIVGKFDYHVGGLFEYNGARMTPDGDLAAAFSRIINRVGKFTQSGFDGNFGYNLGEAGELRFRTTYNFVNHQDVFDLPFPGVGVYRGRFAVAQEEPHGGRAFREALTMNLAYTNPDIYNSAVKVEFFASDTFTENYASSGSPSPFNRDQMINDYRGVRSSITTPLDMLLDGTNVTYGLDYLSNRVKRQSTDLGTGAHIDHFAPDVTLNVLAPYAQFDVPFGDFNFTAGVRHERYGGSAENSPGSGGIVGGDLRDFDLTLFNAGVVYFIDDYMNAFFTFTQGAEISQLGRAARSAGTAAEIDPQPAKSNQYEVGFRGEWDNHRLSLAAFYTESDLLSALFCPGTSPCVPLREPRKFWGIEGTAGWVLNPQWELEGNFAWMDGLREPSTETRRISLSEVPPLLVNGFIHYRPFAWWRNRLHLFYRSASNPFGASTAFGEGRSENVTLANFMAEFDVGPGQLQVGATNLFNATYVNLTSEASNFGFSWVAAEGTRVFTAYTWRW